MSDHITAITDDNFESEVLQSDMPVLVDYWAEWCGPCKALGSVLDEVAGDYADKVKIVKLDIQSQPNTAPRYGVRALPTLMMFKDGKVENTAQGALSTAQLREFLDKAV